MTRAKPETAPAAAAAPETEDLLVLGGVTLRSRLIVGTGKYRDFDETRRAVEASGADMVTVAVRRVNILDRGQENLLDYLDPKRYKILPNTAGCYTVDEAVRTARLARAAGISDLVKLEVIGDPKTLFPDTAALVEAAKILVKEGFVVLPYTNDDPVVAKRLEEVGCAAVMPLAAPIGSGLGIRNPYNLRIIMETVRVPVIVDAGVGTASDAAVAMELGSAGVLMNTAIAGAKDPIAMATAMRYAVVAGRLAYRAGRIERKLYATASSPLSDLIE
jgi:thiazole synthase